MLIPALREMPGKGTATMAELAVKQLRWLKENRLAGVRDLLSQRGLLLSPDVGALLNRMGPRGVLEAPWRLDAERQVGAAFGTSGPPTLVIKGVSLAWSLYPEPNQRLRTDMDLLVSPSGVEAARSVLRDLGYVPSYSVAGGTPTEEEAWRRRFGNEIHVVDLHWRLRGHPCLRDRLGFDEQFRASVGIEHLAPGIRGQGLVHALLTASMHWFDSLYAARYPLVWILDIDLLWRAMDSEQREQLQALSVERGLSALVAENLAQAQECFNTPVEADYLEAMREGGRGRRPTRLIALRQSPMRAHWFALRCEPDARARLRRLWRIFFPSARYLRERYPEGSRFGVVGLWGGRVRSRLKVQGSRSKE